MGHQPFLAISTGHVPCNALHILFYVTEGQAVNACATGPDSPSKASGIETRATSCRTWSASNTAWLPYSPISVELGRQGSNMSNTYFNIFWHSQKKQKTWHHGINFVAESISSTSAVSMVSHLQIWKVVTAMAPRYVQLVAGVPQKREPMGYQKTGFQVLLCRFQYTNWIRIQLR